MAAAAVLWPLLLGLAAFWRVTAPAAVRLCPSAAVPALLLAAGHQEAWVVDVPWLLLGTRVGLDLTGRVFLLLAALVWSCAGMAAPAAVRDDASRGRFAAFFLLSMAGSLGLPLARDAASFYVLFALMSLSAYGLVAHRGDAAARRAGRAYITFAITGEVLLVSGLFFAVWSAGTTSLDDLPARMLANPGGLAAVPLILLGCGMKAGAVPLHPWLPVSYAAAPLPGAVALAGTMSKAGVLGWLRLLPLGHASLVEWSVPVVLLGIAATFYGVAAGLCQRDAKVALAYSSVSQMGFLSAAVGLGMITPSGWSVLLPAVLVYTLHHGLTKGALFLTIAVPGSAAARTQRFWSLAATAALGLSLAGMTLTSGVVAKVSLKTAIAASGAPSAAGIVSALSLAAAGTTLLMARVWWLAARSGQAVGPGSPRVVPSSHPPSEVPLAAWAIAAALALAAPWALMGGLAEAAHAWSVSGVAYILVGLALAGIVAWLTTRGVWRRIPEVPAGDILVPLERAASLLWTFAAAKPASHGHAHPEEKGEASRVSAAVLGPPIVEQALLDWPVYGIVVLALLVAAAAVLGAG
jgi:formate hydrogenlyase subunit 3/multisubunit Na+/H+ antiporter MnhD subunit